MTPMKMRIRAIVLETLHSMANNTAVARGYGNAERRSQLVETVGRVLCKEGLITHRDSQHLRTEQCSGEVEVVVDELLHELLHKNLIKYTYGCNNPLLHFSFAFTEHGRATLKTNPPTVYDQSGFMVQFDKTCSNPPEQVRAFLAAAVLCFNEHTDPALSAVYLGTASELLIDALMEAIHHAMADGGAKKSFREAIALRFVEQRFKAMMKPLNKMAETKGGFPDVTHYKSTVALIAREFDLIRCTRNDAGHPVMPHSMKQSDMCFHLYSFPVYAQRVCELIEYFRSNPVPAECC